MTLGEHAADCRAVLSHAGVPRAHVVGHSFGALVALQLALDSPELVGTLALLEAGLLVGDSADLYRRGLEQSVARYRDVGARVAVDEFFRLRWPAYRERLDRVVPGTFEQALADAATCVKVDLPRGWRRSSARRRRGGSRSRRSSFSGRRAWRSIRASARRTACSWSGCPTPRDQSCLGQAISSSSSNRARLPRRSPPSSADTGCDDGVSRGAIVLRNRQRREEPAVSPKHRPRYKVLVLGHRLSKELESANESSVAVCDNANSDCASPVHHEGIIRRLSTARPALRNPHG